ncbi:MAG: hypothetical protein SNJ69_14000 [Chloroflexaceae bacterium]
MKYRVLIVQPNPALNQSWEEALTRAGADRGVTIAAHSVRSVAAGQLIAGRQSYDLIVANLLVESLSLIRRLRKRWPNLRALLFHTPDAEAVILREAELAGCRLALQPISVADLVSAVGNALNVPLTVGPAPIPETRPAATMADILLLLEVLRRQTHAQFVIYTDNLGNRIAQQGDASNLDVDAITSLIAGSSINIAELGRALHDQQVGYLVVLEGVKFDIYATNAGGHRLLALVCAKEFVEPRAGYIWLQLRRSAQQLSAMRLVEGTPGEVIAAELSASLNREFERLFGDTLHCEP